MLWAEETHQTADHGFTMVELMVVVLIIGILSLLAIVSYQALTARAAEAACLSNQRTLNEALEVYCTDHGAIPATFTVDALQGYASRWDMISVCPLDRNDALYYDPATRSVLCPNHPFP